MSQTPKFASGEVAFWGVPAASDRATPCRRSGSPYVSHDPRPYGPQAESVLVISYVYERVLPLLGADATCKECAYEGVRNRPNTWVCASTACGLHEGCGSQPFAISEGTRAQVNDIQLDVQRHMQRKLLGFVLKYVYEAHDFLNMLLKHKINKEKSACSYAGVV